LCGQFHGRVVGGFGRPAGWVGFIIDPIQKFLFSVCWVGSRV